MKIAVTGKGGVGKTLVAGGLSWWLAGHGYTVLAIDADPSPNLAVFFGLSQAEADGIVPVSENRTLIESKTGTGYPGVYSLNFSVVDIVRSCAQPTPAGVNLLVMGTVKDMGSGCTCPANSVVRALVRHIMTERGEAVVLDMGAGIEHLGRGTAESVDIMLVVTDADGRALDIAGKIARVAQEAGIPRVMLVGNKTGNTARKNKILEFAHRKGFAVLGFVPFDRAVADAGVSGSTVSALKGSTALRAIGRLSETIITCITQIKKE